MSLFNDNNDPMGSYASPWKQPFGAQPTGMPPQWPQQQQQPAYGLAQFLQQDAPMYSAPAQQSPMAQPMAQTGAQPPPSIAQPVGAPPASIGSYASASSQPVVPSAPQSPMAASTQQKKTPSPAPQPASMIWSRA
jgi:hypothetical protein